MFLHARAQGRPHADEWAQSAWQTLSAQGQKLLREGKPVESAEENLAQLTIDARAFNDKRLPMLGALGVA
jgi:hypothetical protein